MRVNVFGRDETMKYSETWVGEAVLALRLVMAWVFLQAGLEKLSEGGWTNLGGFSAEGYLVQGVAEANPLKPVFMWFADMLWLFDPLVMLGQIGIGLALLFGVLFRFSALMGAIQMFFFWTGGWQGGLMEGFPVEHGFFVTSELVYLLLLFGLSAVGAGRIYGLDERIERLEFVRQRPWLRYFLG